MEILTAAFWLSLFGVAPLYEDVSRTHLPWRDLQQLSMDVAAADFDGDGDPDLLVASEFRPNIYLVNDGSGHFSNQSGRIPRSAHDSEDIGVADLDGDGDLDVVIVSEDDRTNELYLNDGRGNFHAAGERLPVAGVSNAVLVLDLDGDGDADMVIGNNGQNTLLINDGSGMFRDETASRLPARADTTQGVAAGDLNGDGYSDLVFANEDANRILLNDGGGRFRDAPPATLPLRAEPEESREVALGDVDGDGDLDIFFANVEAFVAGALRQNRLLLNDGKGQFSDATANLPPDSDRSFTGTLFDIDHDGDLDILTGNANGPGFAGQTRFRVYLNDGRARFAERSAAILPASASGRGFDIAFADFNRDGVADIYLANRGTADILLFGRQQDR
ncbi:FG-GAP repeat domain-containing protein [Haliea sp. E17]|uniref:FG-GAP repeat domain-containing protein n=1 Tax=Haliea sp. E17 TaxID=3401576 RepID=UPI003AAF7911